MITVSKETAILLKEAGWDKPTHFFFHKETGRLTYLYMDIPDTNWNDTNNMLAAPTLQELLEEMSVYVSPTMYIHPSKKYWICCANKDNELYQVTHESPVEAAAQLWLKLRKEASHE